MRYTSRPYFHTTPSGEKKWKLDAEDCIKIQWNRELEEQTQEAMPSVTLGAWLTVIESSRGKAPTGEYLLHAYLQRCIGEKNRVVLHLHPTYIIAAMYKGVDLAQISADFPEINRYTKVGPVVGNIPPISRELALASCKNLGLNAHGNLKYDIIGLDRHGVISVAQDPWAAFEHVERLEHICKIVLAAGGVAPQSV